MCNFTWASEMQLRRRMQGWMFVPGFNTSLEENDFLKKLSEGIRITIPVFATQNTVTLKSIETWRKHDNYLRSHLEMTE